MIAHENPTDESLLHLRTDIMGVLTVLGEERDADAVATRLMNRLGDRYNQTGVAGNPDFLGSPYWKEIEKTLSEKDRQDPFNAPDCVSGEYTNEFILAEELQNARYTAAEATAVILRMREKEEARQQLLFGRERTRERTGKILATSETENS